MSRLQLINYPLLFMKYVHLANPQISVQGGEYSANTYTKAIEKVSRGNDSKQSLPILPLQAHYGLPASLGDCLQQWLLLAAFLCNTSAGWPDKKGHMLARESIVKAWEIGRVCHFKIVSFF
jgi:hypothetical protein